MTSSELGERFTNRRQALLNVTFLQLSVVFINIIIIIIIIINIIPETVLSEKRQRDFIKTRS